MCHPWGVWDLGQDELPFVVALQPSYALGRYIVSFLVSCVINALWAI